MSTHPNDNPNATSQDANRYRGRYATHPGKRKTQPEQAGTSSRSGNASAKSASPSSSKNSRAAAGASASIETQARPAARSYRSSSAAASAADSFAKREKAREERARSGYPSRRTASNHESQQDKAEGATPRTRGERASQRVNRTGEKNMRASSKPRGGQGGQAKAEETRHASKRIAEQETAEYTPYGFEPSARMGRFLRRAPYFLGTAAVVLAAVFIGNIVMGFMPIEVTVNGTPVKISERTVAAAFEGGGQPAKAGDLYDVEGKLLEKGGGSKFSAAVNGKTVDDPETALEKGDAVVFSDGEDREEPLKSQEEIVIKPKSVEEGNGPLHAITQEGANGLKVKKTGKISGKTVTVVEKKAEPRVYRSYFPNVGEDKVIALTFDDGPWAETTEEILDILAANDAKATFFTIGERITPDMENVVKRMATDGHQVCTHTWDHASGSGQGVNLSYMSKDEQREEVQKGQDAIAQATGAEASTVFRAPGGNFPAKVWRNVEDLVSAEIGWDIDTVDWQKPGAEYIAQQIMSAGPGSVVLMHDGGGNRSQTVEALRSALPHLKEQGYRFITIDELLEYPPAE